MTLMQLPHDADYTRLFLTARGMSMSVYSVETGERHTLQEGVWLMWPEVRHRPNPHSPNGTLSNGHAYCFQNHAGETGPVLFQAEPGDVAELCQFGALRPQ
jgi:hypothetical protein